MSEPKIIREGTAVGHRMGGAGKIEIKYILREPTEEEKAAIRKLQEEEAARGERSKGDHS